MTARYAFDSNRFIQSISAQVKDQRIASLFKEGVRKIQQTGNENRARAAEYSASFNQRNCDELGKRFKESVAICSSIPLWLAANPSLKCYISWLWKSFVPHFGGDETTFISIPDEGMEISLNETLKFQLIPAHYLHSSGNFNVYDAKAKILWSGDVGAALLPDAAKAELFVRDFDRHIEFMRGFYQRWMGSNEAKNNWVDRVSRLEVDMICPQHGSIIQGKDVPRFLSWLRELKVGSAIEANRG